MPQAKGTLAYLYVLGRSIVRYVLSGAYQSDGDIGSIKEQI